MRLLSHRNIVGLKYYFYSNGEKKEEVFLNLVLEFVPETVYRTSRQYAKMKQSVPMQYIKVCVSYVAVHVPAIQISCIYSFIGHMS